MMNETTWNREKLERLVRERLGNRRLIIVSNREPYVHSFSNEGITWNQPVGGLTEALDPVMRASGGGWVAQGTGDADRQAVDADDHIAVPPDNPAYTLRRVWLTDEEQTGFYLGFANETLWPLCHMTPIDPVYDETTWKMYRRVNRIFADAVLEEAGDGKAVVLVQDYHFALLPAFLRELRPDLTVGQFWHIPWPPYEVFRTCPWRDEIITGMLGNDLLGFHTGAFCRNFTDSVERSGVTRGKTGTSVETFPISVDFEGISGQADDAAVAAEMANLTREYNLEGKYIGFGTDRLDYTKGIPERLMAFERFLADNPDYRERVVFIQAGMPSRMQIGAYRELGFRIERLITGINETCGTGDWRPVIAMSRHLSVDTLNALRRLAHFCIVSSLDDGMNLVAKEYVAARNDGDGVLVLSEFTGAAVELTDALLINPYDTRKFAGTIKRAVEMPEAERRARMARMRETVSENNIYRWGAGMVSRLMELAGD
ncbi:MAG: trehalose-6-phosphate synthase [Dehalococcoidales bacterium]|nr:trehalose-6-phosphate synthase [Dehalococcoidales bacterium]